MDTRCSSGAPFRNKYWVELQRLQHSIQHTLEQTPDPCRKCTARSATAVLEQQRERIGSISQDMLALQRSCCVEMATSGAPLAPRRSAVRLRAAERRKTRPQKRRRRNQRRRRSEKTSLQWSQLRSHLQSTKSTGVPIFSPPSPHHHTQIARSVFQRDLLPRAHHLSQISH